MKKPLWTMPTAMRLLAFVLLAAAYILALMSLAGCGLLTAAMQAAGVPVGDGASEAAKVVDTAIRSWFDALLWGSVGVATSESARATHRVVKKRREKAAAKKVG